MDQTTTCPRHKPKTEMESEIEPDDGNNLQIPDGGWGWVVCFAGFMINFTAVGLVASNGIILLGLIDLFNDNMSKTSMVGSLFMGISMCVGPLVLLLMMFNASHRQVIIFGGFFSAVSTIASVFAEKIEVLYATYGILSGGFIGISYFAANTIVGSYFTKKRTLAVGIASSGAGGGAFALNYLIERSISFYGMRGTFLLMSGLILNFLVYGALCRPLTTIKKKNKKTEEVTLKSVKILQPETNSGFEPDEKRTENKGTNTTNSDDSRDDGHPGPPENGPTRNMTQKLANKCSYLRLVIFDPDVLKNSGMQLLLTVYLFWAVGEIVLIYLPAKAVSVGLNRGEGALIMSIYGAVFACSQIVVGILADLFHIPTSYLLTFSLLGMSGMSVAFTFCNSFAVFILCASLFAICNGFSSALRVVFVASILGVKNLTKGYSPLCLLIGLAYIIYPIITGALYDATESFNAIFFFGTVCLFISCISSSGIVYMQLKKKFYE